MLGADWQCKAEAERGEYAGINRWRERDSFIEMWRFVVPGQIIAKYLPSFIEYPPMQEGGSFSIQDLKEKVEAAQRLHKRDRSRFLQTRLALPASKR
jgi:hypothetical protein